MTSIKRPHRTTYTCTFCGKDQDAVARLIAGPGNIYICDQCIGKISERPESVDASAYTHGSEERMLRCSFCGKKAQQVAYLVQGPHEVQICAECVDLCNEIIEEERKR